MKIRWIHLNVVVSPLCTFILWANPNLGLEVFFGVCIWVAIGWWWIGREIGEIGEIDGLVNEADFVDHGTAAKD